MRCHLCPAGEIKQRKKAKLAALQTRTARPLKGSVETSQTEDLGAPASLPEPVKVDLASLLQPLSLPLGPPGLHLPSRGAVPHGTGKCRPCAWLWKPQGCSNGQECAHCHACPKGELKARKKAKKLALQQVVAHAEEQMLADQPETVESSGHAAAPGAAEPHDGLASLRSTSAADQ